MTSGGNRPEVSAGIGPLAGIRVVEAATVYAGPLTAAILGDFGADVIKIEHPTGGDPVRQHPPFKEGASLLWKVLGRNKRSVALDLSDNAGAQAFRRLCEQADVLIENFRPGTMERWGLSPDSLRAANPSLVILRVSGFGQDGPYARRPGFGTIAEAMSSYAFVGVDKGESPVMPAEGLADQVTAIAGVSAVSMALFERERNGGEGQVIDLNLLTSMMSLLLGKLTWYDQLGLIAGRDVDGSSTGVSAGLRQVLNTKDGRQVAMAGGTAATAQRLMDLIGRGDLVAEPWFNDRTERAKHAPELRDALQKWASTKTQREAVDAADAAGVALGPVYTVEDIFADPHVRSTGMLVEIDDPDLGTMTVHDVMFRLSRTPGQVRFAGRPLGADTDSVLSDLAGLGPEDIEALRSSGVAR